MLEEYLEPENGGDVVQTVRNGLIRNEKKFKSRIVQSDPPSLFLIDFNIPALTPGLH
jgi:hypothetical protein